MNLPDQYLGGAGLPGVPTDDNSNYISQGRLNTFPLVGLIEMAATAARPARNRKGDFDGRPKATDIQLYPSEAVKYPDGTRAQPIAMVISQNAFLGVWRGRNPIRLLLQEYDALLPYWLAEVESNNSGQPTKYIMQAAAPEASALSDGGRKLDGCLMEWLQLTEEILADAEGDRPKNSIFSDTARKVIVSYRPAVASAEGIQRSRDCTPMDTAFTDSVATFLQAGKSFYADQAAQQIGISASLAHFFLRRMMRDGILYNEKAL